ncbi:MAG: PmoA family protein, partial [Planctomycetes bacterium]|nr:PmoA family protein [Planctomycetota bacterium]
EGRTRKNADGTRAKWCDINGGFDGTDETSGILFMSHVDNRNHPEPMRVWPENMIGGKG